MKKMCIALLTGALLVVAPAGGQQVASDPLDEFGALMGSMVRTATELRSVGIQSRALDQRGADWLRRLRVHNQGTCEYPQGQPEVCAAFTAVESDWTRSAMRSRRNSGAWMRTRTG